MDPTDINAKKTTEMSIMGRVGAYSRTSTVMLKIAFNKRISNKILKKYRYNITI